MPSEPSRPVVYSIEAGADPGVVLRLLNFFAQRNVVPSRVTIIRCGEALSLRIEEPQLGPDVAAIIAEKMRSLPPVRSVLLEGCSGHD